MQLSADPDVGAPDVQLTADPDVGAPEVQLSADGNADRLTFVFFEGFPPRKGKLAFLYEISYDNVYL